MIKYLKSLWALVFSNIIEFSLLASILMLSGAYAFEYIGGLFPCDLCWPQRYAHMAVIIFASFTLYFRNLNQRKWLRFKMMTLFSYAVSVGYSGYHAGVEQKWWEGPDSCTITSDTGTVSALEFLNQLQEIPFVRCDEIPWEMFGVSMAGYNFLISLLFTFMLLLSIRKNFKR